MYSDILIEEFTERICDPKNKTFEDLYIKPVSFAHIAQKVVGDVYYFNNTRYSSKRELAYQ
jgi:hypothetical protein